MRLEKRRQNRLLLSIQIQFKVFEIENLEKDIRDPSLNLKAEIQDVSLGGLQVVSENPFEAGDVLELEMEVPGKGRVRSVAKVVWCKKDPEKGVATYRSGIQFIPVYEDDLKKLEEYLRRGD